MPRKAVAPTEKKKAYSKPVETTTKSLDEIEDLNAHKKAREDKRNDDLTEDLMYGKDAYKRTVRDTMQERDRRHARLHSFGGERDVVMVWDLNADAIRDQVFMISVGGKTTYISAVELQKYLRWV